MWYYLWKGIVPVMMLCEYEKNPSSNKTVIGNIKVLHGRRTRQQQQQQQQRRPGYDNTSTFFLRKADQLKMNFQNHKHSQYFHFCIRMVIPNILKNGVQYLNNID